MSDQRRIILWCFPRSLSTAFCRIMVSRKSCKLLLEPGIPPYYFGAERQGGWDIKPLFHPKEPLPLPNCTWKDYTAELSLPYEGYSEVFVKEIPYRIRKFMDAGTLDDVIPRDYVHAFLIRDPVKTMPSHLKLWLDLRCWPTGRPNVFPFSTETDDPVEFKTRRMFFEFPENDLEYFKRMYEWVVETKGYRPLVIDADDLQKDPESTLRRFCEFVQIDFQDSMINWPPPPPDQAHLFQMFAGVWRKAGETDGIAPLSENDKNKYPEPDEEMQITIDNAMPFYNFLKQAKDKADKTFKVEQCQA